MALKVGFGRRYTLRTFRGYTFRRVRDCSWLSVFNLNVLAAAYSGILEKRSSTFLLHLYSSRSENLKMDDDLERRLKEIQFKRSAQEIGSNAQLAKPEKRVGI